MVDVFISYSRQNQDEVRQLAQAVAALGYDVWWDAELPPHKSYGDVITEKIGLARAAIVVWSQSAIASEWVRAEADVARNQKKLVQTALDDVMPPMPFNQIQFAQLQDWRGETDHPGWRKVRSSLAELCGPPGEPRSIGHENTQPGVPPPTSAWRAGQDGAGRQMAPPAQPTSSNAALIIGLGVIALLAIVTAAWFALRTPQPSTEQGTAEPAPTATSTDPANQADAESDIATDIPDSRFDMIVTVADPDGFTNIREAPSTKSNVIGRVMVGTGFSTFRQPGDWWLMRTPDGTTGYIARSRIRIPGGPDGPPPAANRTGGTPGGQAGAPVERPRTLASDSSQIIPWSSQRPLSADDLAAMDAETLRLARNEIYARNGKRFNDPALRKYFSQQGWYRPAADEVRLTALEQANVEQIQAAERMQ